MSREKVSLDDPLSWAIDKHTELVVPFGVCAHMDNLHGLVSMNPSVTTREGFTIVAPRHAPLGVIILASALEEEAVTFLINKINTPHGAMHVYRDCAELTEEQDAILLSMFEEELPHAAEEFRTGKVVRAKDS